MGVILELWMYTKKGPTKAKKKNKNYKTPWIVINLLCLGSSSRNDFDLFSVLCTQTRLDKVLAADAPFDICSCQVSGIL